MQLRLTVRRTTRRAAHIIAPSEFTRRDLIEIYRLDPTRLSVISLAATPQFRPVKDSGEIERVRRRYGVSGEYNLAVGSIQLRKNLARLTKNGPLFANIQHRASGVGFHPFAFSFMICIMRGL